MSFQNVQTFIEKAKSDPELQKRLEVISGSDPDAAARLTDLSQEYGLPFTADAFFAAVPTGAEISDDEVAGISGGAGPMTTNNRFQNVGSDLWNWIKDTWN